MQADAEKWLKAYVFGPNQPTLADDIAYLANLGITPKTYPEEYKEILGPSKSGSKVGLRNGNMHNAALMAEDYRTGQVLAYAGSADFYGKTIKDPGRAGQDYFDPQYDVLSSGNGRQPGSSFKPINYLIGIQDKSMTAATVFMDVATNFGGGSSPDYIPHDADGLERGPVRMREALQYSLNIPAIKAASISGVNHVMQRAQDFGLRFPAGSNPGVSIGIGTLEVHPADMVSAYGAIADGGTLVQRNMILSVTDSRGVNVLGTQQTAKVSHPSTPQASYVVTNMLAGNTDPAQNNWWSQYMIMQGKTRRPATLKTGTSDNTVDLFALGYVAPPTDPNAPAVVAGVWAGNSDNAPGHEILSLEMAAPIWHAFMQDETQGTPVVDFPQPSGVTWADVDAFSGMLPGPYTTKTFREVFIDGTVPTQADTTKVPLDVDSATNTLWTYDCPGTRVTKGFLDLSHIDATNPTWQQYDNIWSARAAQGVGKRGGPNNAPTSYFYQVGFWTPFGLTWGAPIAPTTYCTSNTGSPPPSPSPTDTPVPTPVPTPAPTAEPTPTPTGSPSPAPSGLLLMPLPLSLCGYIRRRRRGDSTRLAPRLTGNRPR
jgi:membrane peptidoglycan carboxypeptidase